MSEPTRPAGGYEVVRLANGTTSIRSVAEGETFHPVIGPVAEAEALYIRQLHLVERVAAAGRDGREFVLWDVGLGSAANVVTALRHLAGTPARLRVVSFDHTLEPLRFAREHAAELVYPMGFEEAYDGLLARREARFVHGNVSVEWEVHVGDFPSRLASPEPLPAPDAVFYDAYSPARNAAMWTLPVFRSLFRRMDPGRPCAVATYSRATLLRVTLLLAGFRVGAGEATGEKEETTLAANDASLVGRPLDAAWMARARRSTSAEPLAEPVYRQAPLSPESAAALASHPQFVSASGRDS